MSCVTNRSAVVCPDILWAITFFHMIALRPSSVNTYFHRPDTLDLLRVLKYLSKVISNTLSAGASEQMPINFETIALIRRLLTGT